MKDLNAEEIANVSGGISLCQAARAVGELGDEIYNFATGLVSGFEQGHKNSDASHI